MGAKRRDEGKITEREGGRGENSGAAARIEIERLIGQVGDSGDVAVGHLGHCNGQSPSRSCSLRAGGFRFRMHKGAEAGGISCLWDGN